MVRKQGGALHGPGGKTMPSKSASEVHRGPQLRGFVFRRKKKIGTNSAAYRRWGTTAERSRSGVPLGIVTFCPQGNHVETIGCRKPRG